MKVGFYCEDEEGLVTRLDREILEHCSNIPTLLSEFRYFLKSMGYLEDSTNMIQYIKWHNIDAYTCDEPEIDDWILVCNENNRKVWATQYSSEMFSVRKDITHWAYMPYAFGEYIWEDE